MVLAAVLVVAPTVLPTALVVLPATLPTVEVVVFTTPPAVLPTPPSKPPPLRWPLLDTDGADVLERALDDDWAIVSDSKRSLFEDWARERAWVIDRMLAVIGVSVDPVRRRSMATPMLDSAFDFVCC